MAPSIARLLNAFPSPHCSPGAGRQAGLLHAPVIDSLIDFNWLIDQFIFLHDDDYEEEEKKKKKKKKKKRRRGK